MALRWEQRSVTGLFYEIEAIVLSSLYSFSLGTWLG